jgi:hypothetical protein
MPPAAALRINFERGRRPESMNIVVTPARTTVFMDPGLRRDDEKPYQSKTIRL